MGNWLILPFLLLLCFLTGNVLQYITKEEKENRHLHPVLLGAVLWMCCAGSSVFCRALLWFIGYLPVLCLQSWDLVCCFCAAFLSPVYRKAVCMERERRKADCFSAHCISGNLCFLLSERFYAGVLLRYTGEGTDDPFTGQLSGFNALTGAADDLPLRGNVLPVLYACLCRGFSLTPAQLLLQYLPPFLLLLIFLAMAALFTVLPVKMKICRSICYSLRLRRSAGQVLI